MSRPMMDGILDLVRKAEVSVRSAASDLHKLQSWLESQTPPSPKQALQLVQSAMEHLDQVSK